MLSSCPPIAPVSQRAQVLTLMVLFGLSGCVDSGALPDNYTPPGQVSGSGGSGSSSGSASASDVTQLGPMDTVTSRDTTTTAPDTVTPTDTALPTDMTGPTDTVAPTDTALPTDMTGPTDTAAPTDTTALTDASSSDASGDAATEDGVESDAQNAEEDDAADSETSSAPECGDGVCEGVESCASCEADCGVCPCEDGAACDDGDLTTKDDQCDGAGGCAGTPYSCEPTQCEASSVHNGSGCDVEYWATSVECDDGDPGTKDDTCDGAGGCGGTPYSCEPTQCEATSTPNGLGCDVEYWATNYACDDGDASTKDDQCDGAGGCSGTAYTCAPTQCESASIPNGVDCDVEPKLMGIACDDGDASTKDDQCDGAGGCSGTVASCGNGVCGGAETCESCESDCGECPLVSQGSDCADILMQTPAAADGTYVIDPDGEGGEAPFEVYCDMTSGGGGWTTFFVGTNGSPNVFATFEGGADVCPDPQAQCLRMLPEGLSAGIELAASCGSAALTFEASDAVLGFFSQGIQSGWVPVGQTSTLSGDVNVSPTHLWTGAGAVDTGWILSANIASLDPAVPDYTFSNSHAFYVDTQPFDYCNGVSDTSSTIRWMYRLAAPCGDGSCSGAETCESCESDCGVCPEASCTALHFTSGGGDGGGAADDHVVVPDAPAFTLGSDDFTVELWAKLDDFPAPCDPASSADPVMCDKRFITHNDGYNKWTFGYQVYSLPAPIALALHINGSAGTHWLFKYAEVPPPIDEWTHLAVSRAGDVFRLYVQGQLVATESLSITIPDPSANLILGSSEGVDAGGYLSQMRLSSVARYTEESFNPLSHWEVDDDTIALWPLDEGSGTAVQDIAHGHDGTLNDAQWETSELICGLPTLGSTPTCAPDCIGKTCGDDGCGASCGTCPGGESCEAGVCICVPECAGKTCGADGCGGVCGSCNGDESCTEGSCAQPPPVCTSLMLDGSDDFIDLPATVHTEAFTYEMWLQGTPPADGFEPHSTLMATECGMIGWANTNDVYDGPHILVAQQASCQGTQGEHYGAVLALPQSDFPSGWWHLAVTVDEAHQAAVFVDGVKVATGALASGSGGGQYGSVIGAIQCLNAPGNSMCPGTYNHTAMHFSAARISNGTRYDLDFAPKVMLAVDEDTVALWQVTEAGTVADLSGLTGDATVIGATPTESCPTECGDGTCNGAETCASCAADCLGDACAAPQCVEDLSLALALGEGLSEDPSQGPWALFGDAIASADVGVDVTDSSQGQKGGLFYVDAPLAGALTTISFEFWIGEGLNGGADGFALSIVDVDSTAALDDYFAETATGSALGYGFAPQSEMSVQALHLEFDTWYTQGDAEVYDPTPNSHVALTINGDANTHLAWFAVPDLGEGSPWSQREVVLTLDGAEVEVRLDGQKIIDTTLPEGPFQGGYLGFTASTGWASNTHHIRSVTVSQVCEP